MKASKSPKGIKLIQLRDKLARMNGHPMMAGERQKLAQINKQNKIVESQISAIFDSISQYYYKSEQRILTISKQAIEHVHQVEGALIKQLQELKQRQLDAIKQDVDNYLKLKRRTKKLLEQLEISKGNNEELIKSIQRIKPFPIKKIQQKIETCQTQIDDINHKVQLFANLIQTINQNNILPQKQSRFKTQTPGYLRSSHSSPSHSSSSQSRKIVKPTLNKKQNWLKFILSQNDIEINKDKQCNQNQQQNLIGEDKNQANLYKNNSKKQFKNIKYFKSDQEQQCEQKTHKYIGKSIQKTPNLVRKQSHPTIANTSLRNNIQQFLVQLKKSKNQQSSIQISARQKHEVVEASNFLLSRVKSEENINLKKTRGFIQMTQIPLQSPKARITQKISSATSINLSQNRLKESKSSRKGNWANILKDQQTKYNEMRKKIKG